MFLLLRTVKTYIFWGAGCLFFTLVCIPLALLPEKMRYENRLYFFVAHLWCKYLVFFSFLFVRKKGEDNLPKYPNSPAIIVANHASTLDIFLLGELLKSYPNVWLCKWELGKIPLFNILLKRMHVLVDRTNPVRAMRCLTKAHGIAKNRNTHIVMFPEGQRFDDGKVHEFLPGFAILAKKLNRPVIPVAIFGVNKIYPSKKFLIDSAASDVKLVIGEPLVLQESETQEEFVKRVREWFEKCIS